MMRKFILKISQFYILCLWIVSLLYGLLLYCIEPDENIYKFHTTITLIFVFIGFYLVYKNIIKYNLVFILVILIYFLFTHFGMCGVYYLIDKSIEQEFGNTRYLHDSYYLKTLSVALIGFTSTIFGAVLVINNTSFICNSKIKENIEDKIIGTIGLLFLFVSAWYFLYYVVTGRIYFGMDYKLYRISGVIYGIYEWIIVFYMIGACFAYSSASGLKRKISIFLFILTAIILLIFGNRGEVFYPLLACFGIYIIKKRKVEIKLVVLSFLILFITIPFIKIYRHIGTMSYLDALYLINPWNGLAEMGVSFRMTTYIMNELDTGMREFLMGFSYINPIINICDHFVPWSIRLTPPYSFNFTNDFYAMKSMTSVAESYANFGIIGVIIHHILTGSIMAILEGNIYQKNRLILNKLALASSICSVFIYSIRSRIQSVPIEIIVCLVIYLFVRYLSIFLRNKNTF